jgi:16S rRNA (cytosine967-C5)-methyltransferase
LQRRLLENAIDALAPGGRLVYSTCSMEPEENEAVITGVLAKRTDARLIGREAGPEALQGKLVEAADAKAFFDEEGYFRTSPSEQRTDGFFAAVIGKSKG